MVLTPNGSRGVGVNAHGTAVSDVGQEDWKVELNARNLTKVGQFLDANKVPVKCRAIRYLVDDITYCVNGDGWWYFEDEPRRAGWTRCDPPIGL